ncbi:MAG TPA: ribosome maturation factor RimM [Bacilli bacterium]
MTAMYYTVGKIVNTHGIKGELKILSQTDFPETRFKQGSKLTLFKSEQSEKPELSPAHKPLFLEVESSRAHKNVYIIKFKGFSDINEAEKYKGLVLKVSEEFLMELPQDEYYFHEIIGCQVHTEEGAVLGTVTEILATGANDVWVVSRTAGKPLLIPVIDDVVIHVNVGEKQVVIRLMEGML